MKPAMTKGEWAASMPTEWRPHAAAALALYGQPFGFTRYDVMALIITAQYLSGTLKEPARIHGCAGTLHSLAARIEALLPPEG